MSSVKLAYKTTTDLFYNDKTVIKNGVVVLRIEINTGIETTTQFLPQLFATWDGVMGIRLPYSEMLFPRLMDALNNYCDLWGVGTALLEQFNGAIVMEERLVPTEYDGWVLEDVMVGVDLTIKLRGAGPITINENMEPVPYE